MVKMKNKIWLLGICMVLLASPVLAFEGTNATGWEELQNLNMTGAVFKMFDTSFGATDTTTGFFIPILFAVFQFLLMAKVKSPILGIITTTLFVGGDYLWVYLRPEIYPFIALYMIILGALIFYKLKK